MASTAQVWPAATSSMSDDSKKRHWQWPMPKDVAEDELPLRLQGAKWADVERCHDADPDAQILKYVEERPDGLAIVESPLGRHERVVFFVATELTKWAVHHPVGADMGLVPMYNMYNMPRPWPRRVQGRAQEADGAWTTVRALSASRDPQSAELCLVLETAVNQPLEGAVNKVREVWFASGASGPNLALVIKISVRRDSGKHGFRALLLAKDQDRPVQDVEFGWGTGCDRPGLAKFVIKLPLQQLYGRYAADLPAGLSPPRLDLLKIKRPMLGVLEGEGVQVKEKFETAPLACTAPSGSY